MPYSKEQLAAIRKKMMRFEGYGYDTTRRDMCIKELIKYATDDELPGFEDPKSKADSILRDLTGGGNGRVSCWREGCEYVATYSTGRLKATNVYDKCAVAEYCTKQALLENPDELDATSVTVRSQEQIGFICIRFDCDFNCGYTIDGGAGSRGLCQRGYGDKEETK